MKKLPVIVPLIFLFAAFPFISRAEEPVWDIRALNQIFTNAPEGRMDYDMATGIAHWTNGLYVKYGDTVLTADSASVNSESGVTVADGNVRIEQGDQIWVGEHITYNFKTHQMQSEQFRTGKLPVLAEGKNLHGDTSNSTYVARHAFVTSDDVSNPAFRVRASSIKIVPGKYVEMWNAVLFLHGVPAFYYPYYKRNLGERANNLNLLPGYRSSYGPYLLSTYTWFLGDDMDGKIHLDYREKRGVGGGPDVNMQLGRWGDVTFKYYYMHDQNPNDSISTNGFSNLSPIPQNRQRFYFGYQATPFTNLNVKAQVNYQTDPLLLHDYFEGDYRNNPQPNTFAEVNKYTKNWSLDAMAEPRINNFFDQVERLPDVKLTGYPQEVFNTPIYYQSESSAGYYRQVFAGTNELFANTNSTPFGYSAARADTFQQLVMPWTLFGWLNLTPHVGGRFTYYSNEGGPGGTNSETYRTVFNTGIGASFKISRLWANAKSPFLEVDGLRHIVEPSVNYVFVPNPSTPPTQLPQFDSEQPGLMILPVDFPDYNDIDSIDSRNVIRFGLRNTLQTKRDGQLDNLLDWNLMLDWRLKPDSQTNFLGNFVSDSFSQKTFDDLYSDLTFRPRSWLTLESQLRYDINDGYFNLAFHQLTFAPNEKWSWGIGHWYLRGGFLGNGDNLITSTFFYRLNDNWGLRATHYFNAQDGRLQEQFYSIYRDWRSWTSAVTFRVIDNITGPEDFTVAFTFSLKASPNSQLGDDAVKPYQLVGE
jgi:lipopolysaccharide assembly outer membrane protein LptD (OstA)